MSFLFGGLPAFWQVGSVFGIEDGEDEEGELLQRTAVIFKP